MTAWGCLVDEGHSVTESAMQMQQSLRDGRGAELAALEEELDGARGAYVRVHKCVRVCVRAPWWV